MHWYQKGKTNLDFTEARNSECQWYQLGHMHVCNSLQKDNHASTPPLSFSQVGCPSCRPTNSVKALKTVYCTFLYFIAVIPKPHNFFFTVLRKRQKTYYKTKFVFMLAIQYITTTFTARYRQSTEDSVLYFPLFAFRCNAFDAVGWAAGRASGL